MKRNTAIGAEFTVTGRTVSVIRERAEAHLEALFPGVGWMYRLRIEPVARSCGGDIIEWEAEVTAEVTPEPGDRAVPPPARQASTKP